MIKADFFIDKINNQNSQNNQYDEYDLIRSFVIYGHSDSAESGRDIVCSAVSSAVYMAANTITEVFGISPLDCKVSDGNFSFSLTVQDAKVCQYILRGLLLHLLNLEKQYSAFIKVNELSIKDNSEV